MATATLLTFEADGETLAIDAAAVREIINVPRITGVPRAPPSLQGVASVRGAPVPILSVSALRGRAPQPGKRILILQQPFVGLLVDDVASMQPAGAIAPLDLDALIRPALRSTATSTIRRNGIDRKELSREVASTTGLLIFAIGEQEFALPLDQVTETLARSVDITPLSRSDAAVMGTAAYRGAVLPILSLGILLAVPLRDHAPRRAIIVASVQGHRIGLMVDEVRSVTQVSIEFLDPVPPVIARRSSEAKINAICRLDGGKRLVSILDLTALLRGIEEGQLPESDTMTTADEGSLKELTDPFVIFQIGDQAFGLPADVVQEVVRRPDRLTRVPRSPDFIEGIMNLRGRVVPIVDQRKRFGTSPGQNGRERIMIVALGNLQAGFLVDQVRDVLRMPREAVTEAPDLTDGMKLFDRVATLDNGERVVLLIDPVELLDDAEREMLIALRDKASNKS